MKRTLGTLSIAGIAILVAGMVGSALASGPTVEFGRDSTWSAILLSDSHSILEEDIGTGAMPESGSVPEPAVEPAPVESGEGGTTVIDDGSKAPAEEPVGTGSMGVGSDQKLDWPSGYDARPGIDGP